MVKPIKILRKDAFLVYLSYKD